MVVAVHLDVFDLDGGLLIGQRHLVQARGFHVVIGSVVLHEGTEAGQRGGGCDFGVGEVHAEFDEFGR